MMQTATFAKRRHNAESIRGIHPEAILIEKYLNTKNKMFHKAVMCELIFFSGF